MRNSRLLLLRAIIFVVVTTLILAFPQSIQAKILSNRQTPIDKVLFINSTDTVRKTAISNYFRTYENQTYRMKIEYPADWVQTGFNKTNLSTEQLQGIVMFVPPNTTRLNDILKSPEVNVRIGVQDLIFLNISLTQYTNLVIGEPKTD